VDATSPSGLTTAQAPIGLTDLGRVRVLRALAESGQLTRSELVHRTGLARATVGSVIYDLVSCGFVRETTAAEAAGARTGRPPQFLSLEPDSAAAIGLDVGHDRVRVILTDVVGTVRWDRAERLPVDGDPAGALDLAEQLIGAALAETGVAREKILGLGAGFACPVDRDGLQLHAEGIMQGWVGVQPVDALAARTGLPVRIVNDANAGVLAERRYGAARGCDNVLYLRLSSGIGAGAICDGRMLLGHGGIAGELGHIIIDRSGILCRCGNRGCLETLASPPAIADLLARSWRRPVAAADLPDLLRAGDRGTVRAVEDAGDAVGRALATAVMLLNPQMIVVGGELAAAAGDTLFKPMCRAIARDTTVSHAESLNIVTSALGDSAGVRGAAALVLEHMPEALAVPLATAS
jgi:predicted NBD/HSP70 family sugar kinase